MILTDRVLERATETLTLRVLEDPALDTLEERLLLVEEAFRKGRGERFTLVTDEEPAFPVNCLMLS